MTVSLLARYVRDALVLLSIYLAAMLALACATAPKGAVSAREALVRDIEATAKQTAAEDRKLIAYMLLLRSSDAQAQLEADYTAALAEANGDTTLVAAATKAYLEAQQQLDASMRAEALRLSEHPAKIEALAKAARAVSDMRDDEDELTKRTVSEFLEAEDLSWLVGLVPVEAEK